MGTKLKYYIRACVGDDFVNVLSQEYRYLTSSMQNSEAALINVAGTTTQWQSSQSTTGNERCHSTRIREVSRVYARGMGVRISRSHTLILSLNCEMFASCNRIQRASIKTQMSYGSWWMHQIDEGVRNKMNCIIKQFFLLTSCIPSPSSNLMDFKDRVISWMRQFGRCSALRTRARSSSSKISLSSSAISESYRRWHCLRARSQVSQRNDIATWTTIWRDHLHSKQIERIE